MLHPGTQGAAQRQRQAVALGRALLPGPERKHARPRWSLSYNPIAFKKQTIHLIESMYYFRKNANGIHVNMHVHSRTTPYT